MFYLVIENLVNRNYYLREMFGRIKENTFKQISRSGWAGWGSIIVMAMAFLVASIFGGLALISNQYINFIEQKSNLLVFFEVGMDEEIINELRSKWEEDSQIKSIDYTAEEDAYELYSDYTAQVRPEIYAVLKTQDEKKLPSSLDIQIWSLSDLVEVRQKIQTDIDEKLKELVIIDTSEEATNDTESADTEQVKYKYSENPFDAPIKLKVDSENLDQLRVVFFVVRIAGIAVISLLFLVIFFFTFMTVEFRLSNQMEEIGVMQLVGGSLFFIRSPYILEGGFYGFIGSLISSLIIGVLLTLGFVVKIDRNLASFFYENFSRLNLPSLGALEWGLVILLVSIFGFLIGAVSSYLSIRRYIR